jgi:formylmethanofuran dehydrogenase subunit E
MICGRTREELMADIRAFHGFVAPGLLIGAFMVDLAYDKIGREVEADAIVETRRCLPDAIQILTPCTIGNGWLKILDLGKFALTLYDRHTREGRRVWLDLDKARTGHDTVYRWFMGLASKKELPIDILQEAIFTAGTSILSSAGVRVVDYGDRQKKGEVRICEKCHEAYLADQGSPCLACQGKGYYQNIDNV